MMPLAVPTSAAAGVPSSRPVEPLKVAQVGRLAMVNVSVPPLASLALGVNEYCVPTVAVVGGAPAIVGGMFEAATAIENVGRGVEAVPSLTVIAMLLYVRMCAAPGVPCKRPVPASKVAQVGRFAIVKLSGLPSTSAAVGWNTYSVPCVAVPEGVPPIVGAVLLPVAAVTVMENAGNCADNWPSLTLTKMLAYAPAVGIPLSCPVDGLNDDHAGWPLIEKVSESPSASLAVGVNT